jgi:GNAT superfamily N-acetyltransferase
MENMLKCLAGRAMLIQRLNFNHLDEILALYAFLHAEDTPLPKRSIVESLWADILSNPNYRYYGCFIERRLVSSCNLTIVPNLTRGCRSYGLIENVVTHADFRKCGYGKAVLDEALRDAWNAGCYKVMLLTGRKDEATFRFYESAGFDRHEKQAFIAKPVAELE